MNLLNKLGSIGREFKLLLAATLFFGTAGGIFHATLNNYLFDVHSLDAMGRGWLEFPRELPGFLIIGVAALMLSFLRESRIAAVAMVLTCIGALGLGFVADETITLIIFIVIWSLGDHIIFVVEGPLGLNIAKRGGEGRRLGQLGGARNIGVIGGVGLIWLLAKITGPRYDIFYAIAGTAALLSGLAYFSLKVNQETKPSRRFVFKKKYGIFYAISALFGVRKQIFLAFGAWVLVKMYGVPVANIAMLYFIAAALGVLFRPLLGDIIDKLGERVVLAADELLLLLICLTYAFAGDLFPDPWALRVLYFAYIFDSVLFALRIARTTYLKKIIDDPSELTPTISLGITIDHVFAMTLPILSGWMWNEYGFKAVFLLTGAIALVGFFVCLQIKTPEVAND